MSPRSILRPILVVLAAAPLIACSSSADEPPAPDAAVAGLVDAIGSGDFGDVFFASGTSDAEVTASYTTVVEGMDDARPVASLDTLIVDPEDETRATAELMITWDLGDIGAWDYGTTIDLALAEGEDDVDDRWEVAWTPSTLVPDLEPGERLVRERLVPERGDIVGLDDQPIVVDRPVQRIGIDKTRVDAGVVAGSAFALASVLDLDDPAGYRDRVVGAGAQAFVEAIVLRDDGSVPIDVDAIDAIRGASRIQATLTLAPTRDFAREVLGTAGEATAERIESAEGRLEVGDVTGLSGLQLSADEALWGTSGVVVRAVADDDSARTREVFRLEAVNGETIHTSFDVATQLAAEAALATIGPPSALVAIRPSTGQVLAVASGPGSNGFSTATLGQYAPGSTFKVVTSLALLRAGLTPDSPVECPETVTVDGRSFKNYGDYPTSGIGTIPLRTALANSCNTAMIGQAGVASQEDLVAAAASLGIGLPPEVGVPSVEGTVPSDATAVQHAASMIGQDRVLVSPLAMATVAASVGAGRTVRPTLVEPAGPLDGDGADPLNAAEAGALRSMMEAVVADGSGRVLADIPGPPIGAKTGTAEYGTESPPRTHAWMIAVRGDLAVVAFVEDGPGGSSTAGPILEQFFRTLG